MARRSRLILCAAMLCIASVGCGPDTGLDVQQSALRPNTTIAIIGAGAAGLTAAYTLRDLGYKHVAVYEKTGQAGGRVHSGSLLGNSVELGALFATDYYAITLGFAQRYGVPYVMSQPNINILDDDGAVLTPADFAIRKYGLPAFMAAVAQYAKVLQTYPLDGPLTNLPPELKQPFSKFIQDNGIVPLADMFKPMAYAFGYPYYEDVPAAYLLKVMQVMVKMGPTGPYVTPIYLFPTGYQQVFTRLAADLGSQDEDGDGVVDWGIMYNAEVTRILRWNTGSGPKIKIRANGKDRVYDKVIITTPPGATTKYLDMTSEEHDLFGQAVSRNYHVSVGVVLGIPAEKANLVLYPNTRPSTIGHANYWLQGLPGVPVFVAYQNVSWSQCTLTAQALLAKDYADYGGGIFTPSLLHKEWDNFPHFETAALQQSVQDRLEALQGQKGTYFAGSLLGFESVESTSRYARDLVSANF